MKKTLLFFLTLLMLCLGCTLEPSGLSYEEIAAPNPTGFISLNNFDSSDTIALYNATDFEYQISINQGQIKTIQVLLDNTVIYTGSASGKFSLSLDRLNRDPKKLKIEFITSSGTGSLADKAGAENFQIWREWILAVDVSSPTTPVLSLSKENGFMKLNWTGYSKPNFKSYSINVSYNSSFSKRINITNSKENYWIDSAYVGNVNAQYTVTINALQSRTSTSQIWNRDVQEFNNTYRAADSTVYLSWRKPSFRGPFKNYRIVENGIERLVTNINDTTLSFSLKEVVFKKNVQIFFSVRGKDPMQIPVDLTTTITNAANSSTLKGYSSELFYNLAIDKLINITGLNTSNRKIYYYDNSLQKQDSLSLNVGGINQQNGSPYIYYSQSGNIIQQHLLTRAITKTPYTAPSTIVNGPSISGAANGIITYSIMRRTNTGIYYSNNKFYNFDTDNTFYNTDFFATSITNGSSYNVSGQGNFAIFNGGTVYRLSGNMLQLVGSMPAQTYFTRFRDDDDNQIMARSSSSNSLALLNSSDLTTIRTITPPAEYNFSMYDPVTHYALFTKSYSELVYLINIDTRHVKTVKAITNSVYLGYKLINGYLFASDGSYIKVL